MTLRDFEVRAQHVEGDDAFQILLEKDSGDASPVLCNVISANPNCAGPASIPAGDGFQLRFNRQNVEGVEVVEYGYRLVP